MTRDSLLLAHIGELTTNDPTVGDGTKAGRARDAALVIEDGRVAWIGDDRRAPAADRVVDCHHGAVVPGFVDSHTHLVFAGDRADEFAARMGGAASSGGILQTVAATRACSTTALRRLSRRRLGLLRRGGVTTVEVKSGYGLTVDAEARILAVAREITAETTFLGAHAVPEEFASRRDAYVDLVCTAMLDECAPLARWIDVFCDEGAFSVDEARRILLAGRDHGLGLRVHGNQRADSGGVALAVELSAASVDHCTHVGDRDVEGLAASGTVATLLPGAEFSTRSVAPSGRRLLDAGVTVALATDCNPGTSYVTSMSFVIAVAVREMGLTPDEALWAATRGGARALRRDDVGTLGVGARGHALVLDAPTAVHLAYRPGEPLVRRVIREEAGTP